jgi:membrane-bound lytic murein transglycosylase F
MRIKILLLALVSILAACDDPKPVFTTVVNTHSESFSGDLAELKKRGVIRLLRLHNPDSGGLPRHGTPQFEQQHSIESFARQQGLTPEWVDVDDYAELFEALQDGRGDVIVNNLTQTPEREKFLAFSLPLDRSQEFIITKASSAALDDINDLQGKRVAIPAGSSYQGTLLDLLEQNIDLNFDIVILKGSDNPDTLLDKLNSGEFDAAVIDSNLLQSIQSYRQDYQLGSQISELQNIAWAMRPSNPDLLQALNIFLLETLSKQDWDKRLFDDWEGILARKTLRIITRNGPASYFLWRGELMGFDYELMHHFADRHKLKLEMVVAPPQADLIDWLLEGRGDVIAAAMTVSESRRARGILFSSPYNQIAEQLVTATDKPALDSIDALAGRTLALRPNTHYWQTAEKLQAAGHQFKLHKIERGLSTAEVLIAVARGDYDATLADSHMVNIEQRFIDKLSPGFKLEPKYDHAWAVRPENSNLLQQLNRYLAKEKGSHHFNVVKNKHFSDDKNIDKYQGQRLNGDDKLSPFDKTVQDSATSHQFDWRLITAQMYQESRFNPKARSHVGAVGLMQVMPRTARELGYKLPFSDAKGIEAGVTYLAWCRDRFDATLPPQERLWFSLAAYNAGIGHVFDARRLAEQQGLNPDIWFDHVEPAMLLLSQRKYYSQARFGYARGSEPVNYVRQIRRRYRAYLDL